MNTVTYNSLPEKTPFSEHLFYFIMPLVAVVFIAAGNYFKTVPPPAVKKDTRVTQVNASLIFKEEKKPVVVPKVVKKDKKITKVIPDKPVDLTTKPVLKQETIREEPVTTTAEKRVRRVYGLRKVYSRGLGTGGKLSNAVVGKLGNTLNKEIDTITATKSEIKGRVAPTTTVTIPPRFRKRITPAYTEIMKDNQVAGKVKARVLVDVDGKAKKIIITHDLGFGTREASIDAINKMLFEPAKIDDEPVAVWIPLTFRFEFHV